MVVEAVDPIHGHSHNHDHANNKQDNYAEDVDKHVKKGRKVRFFTMDAFKRTKKPAARRHCCSERDPEVSMRIDDFAIMETVGRGTFGKVKAGINLITGEKVALKILSRQHIRDLNVVAKTKREIQVLARLDHPHVIKLHKVICTPTDIFLVSEFAGGGELFDYIVKRGTVMPVKDSRRFFQQIISGVRHCHKHNVVHRDLKPENLLLDEHLNIKIADFGLSNMLLDGALLRTSCGSPNYAAPEVIQGHHYVGPEVDVWSCGIILYVLLVGRLPFDSENVQDLFSLIERGKFNIPRFIGESAASLMQRIICVDSFKRARMEEIVHHDWFTIDLPVALFNEPSDPKPRRSASDKHEGIQPEYIQAIADETKQSIDEVVKMIIEKRYDIDGSSLPRVLHDRRNEEVLSPVNPVMPCIPWGQQYCRPDCDLCPKWGAAECLFAHRIQSLGQCDLCPDKKRKGCLYSLEKLTLEDMFLPVKEAAFQIGAAGAVHKQKQHKNDAPVPVVHTVFPQPVESQIKEMVRTTKRSANKWHLGIRSASEPRQIMLSMYKMLKEIGMSWNKVSTYHLLIKDCRQGTHKSTPLINMQVFRLQRAGFLIDFRHLAPPDAGAVEKDIDPIYLSTSFRSSSEAACSPASSAGASSTAASRHRSRLSSVGSPVSIKADFAISPMLPRAVAGHLNVPEFKGKVLSEPMFDSPADTVQNRKSTTSTSEEHEQSAATLTQSNEVMDVDQGVDTLVSLTPARERLHKQQQQQQQRGTNSNNNNNNNVQEMTQTMEKMDIDQFDVDMPEASNSPSHSRLNIGSVASLGKLKSMFGSALFDEFQDLELDDLWLENEVPVPDLSTVPPSHTVVYLDTCASMIQQMLKG